jgi:diketogulonate reductase-like aldo/keto reductase
MTNRSLKFSRFAGRGKAPAALACSVGRSEETIGELVRDIGNANEIFMATKISGADCREEGLRQFERSVTRLAPGDIDLNQVHNLWPRSSNGSFGRSNLFRRAGDRPVPDWAAEFGATSWAHFFLKWLLGSPAVTVVIPATSDPGHLRDNMGAGLGRVPTEDERTRMAAIIDSLPGG